MGASSLWRRIKGSLLVRNTAWTFAAQFGRLFIQGLNFVVVARALGPEEFGAFASALAFVSVLVPFSGWGAENLLIMHVARDRSTLSTAWGNALLTLGVTSLAFLALARGVAPWFVPNLSAKLVLVLAVAELMFGRVADFTTRVFQAVERLDVSAQIGVLLSLLRLLASLTFVQVTAHPTAEAWSLWYLSATLVTGGIGLFWVTSTLGVPKPAPQLLKQAFVPGLQFSIMLSANTIYTDFDKTLLARAGMLDAAGIYTAAYRAIGLAFVPVRSLLAAAYTRFFRQGDQGIEGSLSLARRLLPIAGAYGLFASVGLALLAPITPTFLGPEYKETVQALQWLAPIPFLQSLHFFAADSLTGAGYYGLRSGIQVAAAVFNVLLSLWLIPMYGWQGAAWASLATDGSLLLGFWSAVVIVWKRSGLTALN